MNKEILIVALLSIVKIKCKRPLGFNLHTNIYIPLDDDSLEFICGAQVSSISYFNDIVLSASGGIRFYDEDLSAASIISIPLFGNKMERSARDFIRHISLSSHVAWEFADIPNLMIGLQANFSFSGIGLGFMISKKIERYEIGGSCYYLKELEFFKEKPVVKKVFSTPISEINEKKHNEFASKGGYNYFKNINLTIDAKNKPDFQPSGHAKDKDTSALIREFEISLKEIQPNSVLFSSSEEVYQMLQNHYKKLQNNFHEKLKKLGLENTYERVKNNPKQNVIVRDFNSKLALKACEEVFYSKQENWINLLKSEDLIDNNNKCEIERILEKLTQDQFYEQRLFNRIDNEADFIPCFKEKICFNYYYIHYYSESRKQVLYEYIKNRVNFQKNILEIYDKHPTLDPQTLCELLYKMHPEKFNPLSNSLYDPKKYCLEYIKYIKKCYEDKDKDDSNYEDIKTWILTNNSISFKEAKEAFPKNLNAQTFYFLAAQYQSDIEVIVSNIVNNIDTNIDTTYDQLRIIIESNNIHELKQKIKEDLDKIKSKNICHTKAFTELAYSNNHHKKFNLSVLKGPLFYYADGVLNQLQQEENYLLIKNFDKENESVKDNAKVIYEIISDQHKYEIYSENDIYEILQGLSRYSNLTESKDKEKTNTIIKNKDKPYDIDEDKDNHNEGNVYDEDGEYENYNSLTKSEDKYKTDDIDEDKDNDYYLQSYIYDLFVSDTTSESDDDNSDANDTTSESDDDNSDANDTTSESDDDNHDANDTTSESDDDNHDANDTTQDDEHIINLPGEEGYENISKDGNEETDHINHQKNNQDKIGATDNKKLEKPFMRQEALDETLNNNTNTTPYTKNGKDIINDISSEEFSCCEDGISCCEDEDSCFFTNQELTFEEQEQKMWSEEIQNKLQYIQKLNHNKENDMDIINSKFNEYDEFYNLISNLLILNIKETENQSNQSVSIRSKEYNELIKFLNKKLKEEKDLSKTTSEETRENINKSHESITNMLKNIEGIITNNINEIDILNKENKPNSNSYLQMLENIGELLKENNKPKAQSAMIKKYDLYAKTIMQINKLLLLSSRGENNMQCDENNQNHVDEMLRIKEIYQSCYDKWNQLLKQDIQSKNIDNTPKCVEKYSEIEHKIDRLIYNCNAEKEEPLEIKNEKLNQICQEYKNLVKNIHELQVINILDYSKEAGSNKMSQEEIEKKIEEIKSIIKNIKCSIENGPKETIKKQLKNLEKNIEILLDNDNSDIKEIHRKLCLAKESQIPKIIEKLPLIERIMLQRFCKQDNDKKILELKKLDKVNIIHDYNNEEQQHLRLTDSQTRTGFYLEQKIEKNDSFFQDCQFYNTYNFTENIEGDKLRARQKILEIMYILDTIESIEKRKKRNLDKPQAKKTRDNYDHLRKKANRVGKAGLKRNKENYGTGSDTKDCLSLMGTTKKAIDNTKENQAEIENNVNFGVKQAAGAYRPTDKQNKKANSSTNKENNIRLIKDSPIIS